MTDREWTMTDVTYEHDEKWDIYRVIWGQRQIAGLEMDEGGRWIVTWGSGGANNRSFPSREAAEQFVQDNAGDIDDGVWV
jgi:hypothetical protein